jgi:dTDP-4-dehydrorhamnose 3,5-epimerase
VKLTPTKIPGALIVEIEPLVDERGFFARTYCAETFRAAGAVFGTIRQTSISVNAKRGTLRGMHWQADPHPEGKIVRAASGRIFDVIGVPSPPPIGAGSASNSMRKHKTRC